MKVMDMIEHVKFLNVVSKGGGLLLTAIGLKMSGNAIEEEKADKREAVTYQKISAFSGGMAFGSALSLIEFTGPIGWVVGIGLTVVTGAVGAAGGAKLFDRAYSHYGNVIGLGGNTVINQVCSR